jgi:surfeit locus 1 family protein
LLLTLLVLRDGYNVRLGIWHWTSWRSARAFNASLSRAAQPGLDLNQEQPENITEMEWRSAEVSGEYDFANQVAIRNQYFGNEYGYHLLTPLQFNGEAVFVDRGWIPADGNSTASDWRKYDEPGPVSVSGQIRLGQAKPAFGGVADSLPENGAILEVWNNADLTKIAGQIPYPVLPVYVQPEADAKDTEPPIPFQPTVELTEGPHFGYALQWFTFATILFLGYPFFLRKQETGSK